MAKATLQKKDCGQQAFRLLQTAFVLVPIIAGLDKFFQLLTNWSMYLSPFAMNILQTHSAGFMKLVGVIEIIAGIGVFFRPKWFAYIVALWLLCIILNLLLLGSYWDIALRDFGLFLGALALGKLSCKYAR